MKKGLTVWAVLFAMSAFGCGDGSKDNNDSIALLDVGKPSTDDGQASTGKVKPIMGQPCDGFEWDNQCYGGGRR